MIQNSTSLADLAEFYETSSVFRRKLLYFHKKNRIILMNYDKTKNIVRNMVNTAHAVLTKPSSKER